MIEVSIIIPIYNVEKYIERCLRSVMAQTYEGTIECILVDDCTPDQSIGIVKRILEAYTGSIEFKIIHHERNKGLSEARNTGIRASQGEYLYFLDSDDAITKDCIEKLLNFAEKYQPDFVIGNVEVIEEANNKSEFWSRAVSTELIEGNKAISRAYANQVWYPMGWNKLILKRFVLHHQLFFYPGIYHEDELWSYTLASLADKMAVCRETTYLYFKREGSIMGSFSMKHIDDLLFVIQRMGAVLQMQPNKYLPVKLRNVSMFFIFRLLDAGYDELFKCQIIARLKGCISRKIKYAFPLNLKDALRALLLILPVKLTLVYARLLKKIIF